MKKTILVVAAVLLTSLLAQAKPCENIAKYQAIRSYKSEVGTVQGSDGIQYSSSLKSVQGKIYTYEVAVFDNNDEGDTWEVNYIVTIKNDKKKCITLNVANVTPDSELAE
jgi:hypothetical protein